MSELDEASYDAEAEGTASITSRKRSTPSRTKPTRPGATNEALDQRISDYYVSHGIDGPQRRCFEEIRLDCPARQVGKGALGHTSTRLFSRRNGESRHLESMTCEGVFALELELSDDVSAYFCQPRIFDVRRHRGNRDYVNPATLDFLVYGPDGSYLVECKPVEKLIALASESPEEWILHDGFYRNIAYQGWEREHGIEIKIWSPPVPSGIYLANLNLLYAVRENEATITPARTVDRLLATLQHGPLTCDAAIQAVRGLTLRGIWQLLACGHVFGTVRSCPLDHSQQFRIYFDQNRAAEEDEKALTHLAAGLTSQTAIEDALVLSSTTDYDRANERHARLERIAAGAEPQTERMRRLAKKIAVAGKAGMSAIEACLTHFSRSGNRTPRLSPSQADVLDDTIRTRWLTNEAQTKIDLQTDLENACEKLGIRAPSRATVAQRIKHYAKGTRALAVGGRKSFHAAIDPTDPLYASIAETTPWIVCHIDSTKWDQRIDKATIEALPFECPTLYVAIDGCGHVIGRALLFGDACRAHAGVLFRDIVKRHGRLPHFLVADGGGEYRTWLDGLLDFTRMSRRKPPTGKPQANSRVENAFKQLNFEVAHKLVGSALPDRSGRRVDNKFKSYRNARMLFTHLLGVVDAALFDLGEKPGSHQPGSPHDRASDSEERVGLLGIPTAYDEAFLFATSVPLDRKVTPDGTSAIRHESRTFRGAELSRRLAFETPVECRRDCVDPTTLWVKFKRSIVRASSSDALSTKALSYGEMLFELMMAPELRRRSVARKAEIRRVARKRVLAANAAAEGTAHLIRKQDQVEPPSEAPPAKASAPWYAGLSAFPTRAEPDD